MNMHISMKTKRTSRGRASTHTSETNFHFPRKPLLLELFVEHDWPSKYRLQYATVNALNRKWLKETTHENSPKMMRPKDGVSASNDNWSSERKRSDQL